MVEWNVRNDYETNVGNKGDLHETRRDFTELNAFGI